MIINFTLISLRTTLILVIALFFSAFDKTKWWKAKTVVSLSRFLGFKMINGGLKLAKYLEGMFLTVERLKVMDKL